MPAGFFKVLLLAVHAALANESATLELAGDAALVNFAEDTVTLSADSSVPGKLVCSGEFAVSDVRLHGTDVSVADLIAKVATLEEQLQSVQAVLGGITAAQMQTLVGVVARITPPSPPPPTSPS